MKLNIIYIHSHDTGRFIGPYGYSIPTPNLQKFAEQGVLFRQAFCAAPTCSPSRAALLTGQNPHSAGMVGLAHRGFALTNPQQHLCHTLGDAGYKCVLAGGQYVAAWDRVEETGYQSVVGAASNAERAACHFLENAPTQPFFLDVGFHETHRNGHGFDAITDKFCELPDTPDEADREHLARYCRPPAPLPDTLQTRRDMADYMVAAQRLDRKIGEVLDAIDAAGLRDSTLVIVTTDHGIAFPNMKCSLTAHGTGVLLLRGPKFEGGQVCDALVSHLDLYPTLCDLIGIARPSWLEGASLLPLMRGEVDEIRDTIFSEVTYHAAFEPKRGVRTRRWNYIRYFDARHKPVLPNCDDSSSKDLWLENGWRERAIASEELFDLMFDPNESNNVAGDGQNAAVLEEIRACLDAWMRRTNDPLLDPNFVPPPAAVVNDPDGTSPEEELLPVLRVSERKVDQRKNRECPKERCRKSKV